MPGCGVCMGHSPSWDGHDHDCSVSVRERCLTAEKRIAAALLRISQFQKQGGVFPHAVIEMIRLDLEPKKPSARPTSISPSSPEFT